MKPIDGWGVFFSGPNDPDLEKEWFDAKTDLDLAGRSQMSLHFDHGMDQEIGPRRIGMASLTLKSGGLWVRCLPVPELPPRLWDGFVDLASEGVLGFSTGALSHLTEREPRGGATYIKRWPIGEISLTCRPCEPRCKAVVGAGGKSRWQLDAEYCAAVARQVQAAEMAHDVDRPFDLNGRIDATTDHYATQLKAYAKTVAQNHLIASPGEPFFMRAIIDPTSEDFVIAKNVDIDNHLELVRSALRSLERRFEANHEARSKAGRNLSEKNMRRLTKYQDMLSDAVSGAVLLRKDVKQFASDEETRRVQTAALRQQWRLRKLGSKV